LPFSDDGTVKAEPTRLSGNGTASDTTSRMAASVSRVHASVQVVYISRSIYR
jgi:hypothetical protein